jgi:hypothetical protein
MARVTKNSSFHHSIFSQTLDPPLYDFSLFSLLSQQSIMVFPQFFFLSKFPFLSLSLLYLSVASCNYKKLNGTRTILVPFFFFMYSKVSKTNIHLFHKAQIQKEKKNQDKRRLKTVSQSATLGFILKQEF